MSSNQDPSKELERIEQAIRKCREELAASRDANREGIETRLRELGRDLSQVVGETARSTIDAATPAGDGPDTTLNPTMSLESPAEETRSFSGVKQTVIVEAESAGLSGAASIDPRQQQAGHSRADLGDYEILSEVAKGGMGVVYKARQTKLNRIVALKMIRSGELADEAQIKRFYTEAEAAAKLDHPGIVPVYDVGKTGGQHYFSMAFIEGRSLNERVKDDGLLPPEEAARLIRDTARAVVQAHASGVLHRDLKPHNIMLDVDGSPKVTDFGLAKLQQSDSEMTATGQVLGTPSYMPPEQAAGRMDDVGIAADVYSLGATLYFALTGRPPFQSASFTDTLRQVIEDEPVAPRQLTPTIPRDLETICLKCLRKESGKRYLTANDLADDLQRWLDGEPILARRVSRAERVWKWCKRKPVIVGSVAAFVTLLLVGSLVFWERQNATYADGLVQRLRTAEQGQVKNILDELLDYRRWAQSDVRANYANANDGSLEQLHFGLGLLPFDDPPIEYVTERLLTVPPNQFAYIGVIAESLGEHRDTVVETLWERFHDASIGESIRFRAGLALAHLDGESDRWGPEDATFLVDQFVSANAFVQPDLLRLLDRMAVRLTEPLTEVFVDTASSQSQQVAAANALAAFCPNEPMRLQALLTESTLSQFEILFPAYEAVADQESFDQLAALVNQQPSDAMEPAERISLGRRRAKAAIMLMRGGERESIFDVLRYTSDPEAMTQFIHLSRDFGVDAEALIECLRLVDEARGPLEEGRQKKDDSLLYALLLALGDFPTSELPINYTELAERLVDIYAQDPSSGVHSATGWLLRQWGYEEEVTRIDRTALPQDPSGHREWYVMKIGVPEFEVADATDPIDNIYLTMIVFQPGEFEMGSPENEIARESDEGLHRVKIEHQISVCDRELRWRQVIPKEGDVRRKAWSEQFFKNLTLDEPVFGFNWFEAVEYCHWLTMRAGLSPSDLCYEIPEEGQAGVWPIELDRSGFRQLTEQEWEYVCRSGNSTAYSFGNDVRWLGMYGWHLENSDEWSHAVAELRPNPRGLFDNHGNLYEWCYDWYGLDIGEEVPKSTVDTNRVSRGGAWSVNARSSRSAYRGGQEPTARSNDVGFRIARGPSGQLSAEGQE